MVEMAEATRVGSACSILFGAPIRVPVTDLRHTAVVSPRWPTRLRPDDGTLGRYRHRIRRRTSDQEAAILRVVLREAAVEPERSGVTWSAVLAEKGPLGAPRGLDQLRGETPDAAKPVAYS